MNGEAYSFEQLTFAAPKIWTFLVSAIATAPIVLLYFA